jgi:hypothetical protein
LIYNPCMSKSKRAILLILAFLALLVTVLLVPPLSARLAWRLEDLNARVFRLLNPPEQVTFKPGQGTQPPTLTAATLDAVQTTPLPAPTSQPSPGPTWTPTITPTPLPETVSLTGFRYESQRGGYNYCGPANFSMALNFWGWKGDRNTIVKALMPGNLDAKDKPVNLDKNVMPYELQEYVRDNVPGLKVIIRMGGDVLLLKRLLAAGFPPVVEKGYYETDYTGKLGWMGHYQFVTGYDEPQGTLIVQDTYNDGPDFHIGYDEFMQGWRAFNYLFLIVYPQERETEVFALLGPWADEWWAAQHALEVAQGEVDQLTGVDQFFAQFNIGSSLAKLQRYAEASYAFDQAFIFYNALPDDGTRPYRMMWYQTWPYWAYYYSYRYSDVISLANTTLNETISKPVLEESLYWRGMAHYALGEIQPAIDDFRAALRINPGFEAARFALQNMGVSP